MMKSYVFAFLIFGAFSVCNASPVGKSFAAYRSSLIKAGWMPFEFHRNKEEFPLTGEEVALQKAKIYEVEGCSMDAGVLCKFWYTKGEVCLMVETKGERLKDKRVFYQKRDACPTQ